MSKSAQPPKLRLVEETGSAQCPQAYTVRPTEVLPAGLPRRDSYGSRPYRGSAAAQLKPLPLSDDVALQASTPGYELVDCFALIDAVLELLHIPAGFKIALAIESAPFLAARMALDTVLYEILDNAISHHDDNRGRLHIALEAQACCHLFTITDDGPGVPASLYEDLAALHGAADSSGESIGGLGICARLAEKHGAKLDLEVRPGQRGTVVRLAWPHFEWDYQWRKHS